MQIRQLSIDEVLLFLTEGTTEQKLKSHDVLSLEQESRTEITVKWQTLGECCGAEFQIGKQQHVFVSNGMCLPFDCYQACPQARTSGVGLVPAGQEVEVAHDPVAVPAEAEPAGGTDC